MTLRSTENQIGGRRAGNRPTNPTSIAYFKTLSSRARTAISEIRKKLEFPELCLTCSALTAFLSVIPLSLSNIFINVIENYQLISISA